MEETRLRKMVDAAKLYYQLDYSQHDISRKLGVSRPTVSRLLQQAKQEGIVQIKIIDPTVDCENLSNQLIKRFNLKSAIVIPVPQNDDQLVKKYLGEAAALYLHQIVNDGDVIAVSWGTTLYEVALHMETKHVKNVTVVQLNGGVSHSETNTYASEVIYLLGKAYHTTPYHLPLPAIVDHVVVKQAIEADRHIRKVLDMGKQANIAVYTVGVPTADSVLIKANYFTAEDLAEIHAHAVGDICSRYFDVNGKICSENLNNRTISIALEEFCKKEHSILVAGGPQKVAAIYGALKGKYANTLITDQFSAAALLEIEK